jgi:hypothetical protein
MLDDGALSHLKGVLDLSSMAESDANAPTLFPKRIRYTFHSGFRKRVITNPRIWEILLNNL